MSVSVEAQALVGPDWIAARSGDGSVRVVEVDVSPAAFDAGHIPARCSGTRTAICARSSTGH